MIVKIDPNDLEETVREQLQDWANGTLRRAVNEAVKETAATTAKLLKQGGGYEERTGKYSKDWDSKLRAKSYSGITGTEEWTVYNKKHYQLTHLLEKGHQKRNGGRTKAFEHIGPVQELAEQLIISNVGKKAREME